MRGVKVVVSDGSTSYRKAIGQHLGHARHVLDRFHVARVRHEALCYPVGCKDPPVACRSRLLKLGAA